MTAVLYLPSLFEFRNYTIAIFYRWWTVHLWVEGVWEMIQGALLAYLLIRLSGIDREVMEKWLYVIVGPDLHLGSAGYGTSLLLRRRSAVLAAHRRVLLRARAARVPGDVGLRLLGDPSIRACRIRTRWRSTGRSEVRCFPRSGPACSDSRTRGLRSTSGPTARSSRRCTATLRSSART